MICTCPQCIASDYTERKQHEGWQPTPDEILTAEQSAARLDAVLQAIEASVPRRVNYSSALADYERRSKQSIAEWLEENMRNA